MIKFLVQLVKWASWVHEFWHWLAAKILKMEIEAHPDRVYFELSEAD